MHVEFLQAIIAIGVIGTLVWGILTSSAADLVKFSAVALLLFAGVIAYIAFVIEPRIKKLEGGK